MMGSRAIIALALLAALGATSVRAEVSGDELDGSRNTANVYPGRVPETPGEGGPLYPSAIPQLGNSLPSLPPPAPSSYSPSFGGGMGGAGGLGGLGNPPSSLPPPTQY